MLFYNKSVFISSQYMHSCESALSWMLSWKESANIYKTYMLLHKPPHFARTILSLVGRVTVNVHLPESKPGLRSHWGPRLGPGPQTPPQLSVPSIGGCSGGVQPTAAPGREGPRCGPGRTSLGLAGGRTETRPRGGNTLGEERPSGEETPGKRTPGKRTLGRRHARRGETRGEEPRGGHPGEETRREDPRRTVSEGRRGCG